MPVWSNLDCCMSQQSCGIIKVLELEDINKYLAVFTIFLPSQPSSDNRPFSCFIYPKDRNFPSAGGVFIDGAFKNTFSAIKLLGFFLFFIILSLNWHQANNSFISTEVWHHYHHSFVPVWWSRRHLVSLNDAVFWVQPLFSSTSDLRTHSFLYKYLQVLPQSQQDWYI